MMYLVFFFILQYIYIVIYMISIKYPLKALITLRLRAISGYKLKSGSDRGSSSACAEKNISTELGAIVVV